MARSTLTASRLDQHQDGAAAATVSLLRLYILRLGYLVLAVGLALTKWPLSEFYACLLVVIPLAVIPWRYVVAHYVRKPGDQWRSTAHR